MRTMLLSVLGTAALIAQSPKPAEPKAGMTTAAAMNSPSYRDLKFPPLREVKLPKIDEFTLPNGIHLYLMENHELPLVNGFALVRTGTLFDPAGKTGLSEMMGHVMRTGGTTTKSGDDIDLELENIAASVESSMSANMGRVGFSCIRDNTDQVLAIFRDVLIHPAFRQEKIDLAKTQFRGAIARRNDDAGSIPGRELSDILYGRDTPYGREMEYSDLDAIHRDDLVAFHTRYYFPANTIIAAQGDFSSAEMKAKLEKLFADWDSKQQPVPPWPNVEAKPQSGIYLGVKNDVTQTFFEMGHLAGLLKDPDYPALEVMADILGGGFSSRLFKDVRTRQGLAYNISASWGAGFTQPGIFRISGSTKSASTVDAIKAAQGELKRIRETQVSDEELKTAKDTVLNSFVFNFDSPSKTLGRLILYEYNHYPKDFIFTYQKAIANVTKADVQRVAQKWLHPEQLTIVAVGKPSDFGTPLTAIGPVKPLDLTVPEPKAAAAPASSESLQQGKQLLNRAQQAVGGADKLAAVKSLSQSSEAQLSMGGAPMKVTQQTDLLLPSTFRQTQNLPYGKVVVYSDTKTGWMMTPQGQVPMPDPVLRQVRGETFRELVSVLLSDRHAGATVNAVAPDTIEIADGSGESARITLDGTGLPVKMTYASPGMGTGPAQVTESYSDWKEVSGGLKMPMHIVIEQDGRKFADTIVKEVKINPPLTKEELSRKP